MQAQQVVAIGWRDHRVVPRLRRMEGAEVKPTQLLLPSQRVVLFRRRVRRLEAQDADLAEADEQTTQGGRR